MFFCGTHETTDMKENLADAILREADYNNIFFKHSLDKIALYGAAPRAFMSASRIMIQNGSSSTL